MPTLRSISTARTAQRFDRASELAHALRAYFESGVTRPRPWRLSQLDALEHFLIERERDIVEALYADLRKPETEAVVSEIGFTLAELRSTRKNLASWMKPERVRTPVIAMPGRSYVYREPLGVVLIMGPWNYPFQTLALPMVGALAAGNCVVLKPSEISSGVSEMLARWIPKYLDPKAVQVWQGGVPETTALLRERWDHIFYTGNGRVGRIVLEAAAKHLTPVTLELGGKSPCIVDESADLDIAAKRIVYGKFVNAGQTCVAPDYVLVDDVVHDALVNRMASTIRELYGDDPQKSPDYARVINEQHHARLTRLLASGEVAAGGRSDLADLYIAPTILRNVSENDPVMREEIFGPILPVIAVSNVDAAIELVNRHPRPLALYAFSRNKSAQERILSRTIAGGTTINHVWMHLGVPALPFGGVGESGMGAYHGRHTFETFSHRRAVLKKPALPEPPLLYPPYSARKLRWIRRLF
jgi:aldehyde dehydrogenase (NAD+)